MLASIMLRDLKELADFAYLTKNAFGVSLMFLYFIKPFEMPCQLFPVHANICPTTLERMRMRIHLQPYPIRIISLGK